MASCVDADPAAAPTPDGPLLRRERQSEVRRALEHLPDRERTILVAFYFDERSLEDVARELGLSISWASRLHHKGLDRLRELLSS